MTHSRSKATPSVILKIKPLRRTERVQSHHRFAHSDIFLHFLAFDLDHPPDPRSSPLFKKGKEGNQPSSGIKGGLNRV